ncbi:MAG: hypothetical protein NT157_03820 [Candidatus Micrarchaeota archaeon]|nr:hypothetical protein [Candidatus Micrarchaeota archaeon]
MHRKRPVQHGGQATSGANTARLTAGQVPLHVVPAAETIAGSRTRLAPDSANLSTRFLGKGSTYLKLRRMLTDYWEQDKKSRSPSPFALEFLLNGFTNKGREELLELLDCYFMNDSPSFSQQMEDGSRKIVHGLANAIKAANPGAGGGVPEQELLRICVTPSPQLWQRLSALHAYVENEPSAENPLYVENALSKKIRLVEEQMELMRASPAESEARNIFESSINGMRPLLAGVLNGTDVKNRIEAIARLLGSGEFQFSILDVAMMYAKEDRQLLLDAAVAVFPENRGLAIRLLANFDFTGEEFESLASRFDFESELEASGIPKKELDSFICAVAGNRLERWVPQRAENSHSDYKFAEHAMAVVSGFLPSEEKLSAMTAIIPKLRDEKKFRSAVSLFFSDINSLANEGASARLGVHSLANEGASALLGALADSMFRFEYGPAMRVYDRKQVFALIEESRQLQDSLRSSLLSSILANVQLMHTQTLVSSLYDRDPKSWPLRFFPFSDAFDWRSQVSVTGDWKRHGFKGAGSYVRQDHDTVLKIYKEASALGEKERAKPMAEIFEKTFLPKNAGSSGGFPGIPLIYDITSHSFLSWFRRVRMRYGAYGKLREGLKSSSPEVRKTCAEGLGWGGFASGATPRQVIGFISSPFRNKSVRFSGTPRPNDVRSALRRYAQHLSDQNIGHFTSLLVSNEEFARSKPYFSRTGKRLWNRVPFPGKSRSPVLSRRQYTKLVGEISRTKNGEAALNACASNLLLLKFGEKNEFRFRNKIFDEELPLDARETIGRILEREADQNRAWLEQRLSAAYVGATEGKPMAFSNREAFVASSGLGLMRLREELLAGIPPGKRDRALLLERAALARLELLHDIKDFDRCLREAIGEARHGEAGAHN